MAMDSITLRDDASPTLRNLTQTANAAKAALEELGACMANIRGDFRKLKGEMESSLKVMGNVRSAWWDIGGSIKQMDYKSVIQQQKTLQQERKKSRNTLKQQAGAYEDLAIAMSKADNKVAAGSGGAKKGSGIDAQAKGDIVQAIGDMVIPAGQDMLDYVLHSNLSGGEANQWSGALGGALSGAASGAALGTAILPGIGTAIGAIGGALLGGITGWISAWTKELEKEEDAYREYVSELSSTLTDNFAQNAESGIEMAAVREQMRLNLKSKLKDAEQASQVYEGMEEMARATSFTFNQLSGSSQILAAAFQNSGEILDWMELLADSAAALGLSESDMQEMSQSLASMQKLGTASRQDLDVWANRDVDVYQALADDLGISREKAVEKADNGEITSKQAFAAIQGGHLYEGERNKPADSYAQRMADMEDAVKSRTEAAYGEAYNAERMDVLQTKIDWFHGENGERLQNVMEKIGTAEAQLKNEEDLQMLNSLTNMLDQMEQKEREFAKQDPYNILTRSVDGQGEAVMQIFPGMAGLKQLSERNRQSWGLDGLGYKSILLAAEAEGQMNYELSAIYQRNWEEQAKLRDMIEKTAAGNPLLYKRIVEANNAAEEGTGAGKKGKGMQETIDSMGTESYTLYPPVTVEPRYSLSPNASAGLTSVIRSNTLNQALAFGFSAMRAVAGHASGLTRVPYDNYPALLHQGERVLTAQEVRQGERSSGGVTVTITGNTFTGSSPADARSIAEQVAAEVARKLLQASRIAQ